jgi:hypothetical protein
MNYTVLVEGQSIPVPEEIGANDDAVKRALAPFYPEVANALITRVEKAGEVTINVIKKAGSKGGGPAPLAALAALAASPGGQNPAIALYQEIQGEDDLDPYTMLELDARIDSALEVGEKQGEHVKAALRRLEQAQARPAGAVVLGF